MTDKGDKTYQFVSVGKADFVMRAVGSEYQAIRLESKFE